MVAGGQNSGALSSAELYDPTTGTWTVTGSLFSARFVHTVTLLPNGKVLVAAGLNGGYTGAFLGPLTDSNNNTIVILGLWDLSFGNGRNNGTAGPNAPNFAGNGLFGVILATEAQGNAD